MCLRIRRVNMVALLFFAGDTEDSLLIAVVAVTVGYGIRPESLVDV